MVGHTTLMAHRHIDAESHSRPVARCPARMLRHTADHRPATNHASGSFLPQGSVTWIKQRTKRRCCWRNAVKGFSCSRDRSSLSCAPAPRASNTIPPRSTCMATVRPNRPNHSETQSLSSGNKDFDTQEYSSRAILSCSRVALNGWGPHTNDGRDCRNTRKLPVSACTKLDHRSDWAAPHSIQPEPWPSRPICESQELYANTLNLQYTQKGLTGLTG